MSRPATAKVSLVYQEHGLTARTPHSRAGSFKELQANQPLLDHDNDYSPNTSIPKHTRAHVYDKSRILHYFPLATASLCGIMLLVLTIISYRRPDVIYWIIGHEDWYLSNADNNTSVGEAAPVVHTHTGTVEQPQHPNAGLVIDYSNYTSFPLTTMEYAAECWKLHQKPHKHGAFWAPGNHGVHDVLHTESPNVCSSSITYMLDGEIGLAADLALIAQIAGLARERNRTFFIDDTYWNRGSWLDYFEDVRLTQPGPEPGCLPPPANELVACPRLARHWVVTSHTAKFHMTHDFSEAYQDPYKHSVDRQRPIFETGRLSMSDTIRPTSVIGDLVHQARSALSKEPYIGVHIRRGDQPAMSWRYHKGYVPTSEYVSAVQQAVDELDIDSIYVSSDALSGLLEFSEGAREEWHIHASLATAGSQVEYSVDRETEGYFQNQWDYIPDEERAALTRGMIIDLALVTGAWAKDESERPSTVICTLSSHVCRIAAMTLGWERSIEQKGWVEIDNRGDIEPVWDAFQLYH
ncbi:hypothetical protein CALCODRAFT_330657 [Calocera cornea HHB12733]|uniref:Glycosyltransferase family 23 protein n=1 Tax=Calocera cornea HHB12733 TaxID=1353952 RepID=A0A165F3W1_9BASI|nr:hypothetical protein CALCODRAFT_330657 [Calocera cornea HHB12733]